MAKAAKPATGWWQRYGNLSQMASAVASIVALTFVAYQVSLIEVTSRKASARTIYQNYSNASLQHPDLIKPDFATIKRDPVKYEQYKWYVGQMLFAYDEMIDTGDKSWIDSFHYELAHHTALLCELRANDPAFYGQFQQDALAIINGDLDKTCPKGR